MNKQKFDTILTLRDQMEIQKFFHTSTSTSTGKSVLKYQHVRSKSSSSQNLTKKLHFCEIEIIWYPDSNHSLLPSWSKWQSKDKDAVFLYNDYFF